MMDSLKAARLASRRPERRPARWRVARRAGRPGANVTPAKRPQRARALYSPLRERSDTAPVVDGLERHVALVRDVLLRSQEPERHQGSRSAARWAATRSTGSRRRTSRRTRWGSTAAGGSATAWARESSWASACSSPRPRASCSGSGARARSSWRRRWSTASRSRRGGPATSRRCRSGRRRRTAGA